MGSLKEIRSRIRSVKNTRKITSAMSRIAAARLVRAQQAATSAQPYGDGLQALVSHVLGAIGPGEGEWLSPLLARPKRRIGDVDRVALVLVTADRGLCGGFNANANRAAHTFLDAARGEGRDVVFVTVGRKGRSHFVHDGIEPVRHHPAPELGSVVESARAVAKDITAMFTGEADPKVNEVVLVYNHFKSVLTQEVRTVPLLPFTGDGGAAAGQPPELEPELGELLALLLPQALEARLQQAMFNSVAAEVAARRMAMNSATDNATDLIGELTLIYNRERQAAITKELMEIIGGAEALKG